MNLGENSVLPKMRRQQHDFSKPGWGREIGLRSRLDFHRTIGDTGHTWTSLMRKNTTILIKEAYFYAGWLPVTPRCASRGQMRIKVLTCICVSSRKRRSSRK